MKRFLSTLLILALLFTAMPTYTYVYADEIEDGDVEDTSEIEDGDEEDTSESESESTPASESESGPVPGSESGPVPGSESGPVPGIRPPATESESESESELESESETESEVVIEGFNDSSVPTLISLTRYTDITSTNLEPDVTKLSTQYNAKDKILTFKNALVSLKQDAFVMLKVTMEFDETANYSEATLELADWGSKVKTTNYKINKVEKNGNNILFTAEGYLPANTYFIHGAVKGSDNVKLASATCKVQYVDKEDVSSQITPIAKDFTSTLKPLSIMSKKADSYYSYNLDSDKFKYVNVTAITPWSNGAFKLTVIAPNGVRTTYDKSFKHVFTKGKNILHFESVNDNVDELFNVSFNEIPDVVDVPLTTTFKELGTLMPGEKYTNKFVNSSDGIVELKYESASPESPVVVNGNVFNNEKLAKQMTYQDSADAAFAYNAKSGVDFLSIKAGTNYLFLENVASKSSDVKISARFIPASDLLDIDVTDVDNIKCTAKSGVSISAIKTNYATSLLGDPMPGYREISGNLTYDGVAKPFTFNAKVNLSYNPDYELSFNPTVYPDMTPKTYQLSTDLDMYENMAYVSLNVPETGDYIVKITNLNKNGIDTGTRRFNTLYKNTSLADIKAGKVDYNNVLIHDVEYPNYATYDANMKLLHLNKGENHILTSYVNYRMDDSDQQTINLIFASVNTSRFLTVEQTRSGKYEMDVHINYKETDGVTYTLSNVETITESTDKVQPVEVLENPINKDVYADLTPEDTLIHAKCNGLYYITATYSGLGSFPIPCTITYRFRVSNIVDPPTDEEISGLLQCDMILNSNQTTTVRVSVPSILKQVSRVRMQYGIVGNKTTNWLIDLKGSLDYMDPTSSFYHTQGAYLSDKYGIFKLIEPGRYTISVKVIDFDGTRRTLIYTMLTEYEQDGYSPIISGVKDGECYNSLRTLHFVDRETGVKSALVNDKPVYTGYKVSNDGKYTVTCKDYVGNATTLKFTIDKTAPTITGVKNNSIYKKQVKIKFSDNLSGIKWAKLDTQYISSSYICADSGEHVLTVMDMAGNKVTYKFMIDNIPPTVKGVKQGKVYKSTRHMHCADSLSGIKSIKLNGKAIPNHKTMKRKYKTVKYKLVVTDNAGNKTKITFTIKKKKKKK